MIRRGIFIKVFLYTALFLVLVITVTAALFAQQIVSFYNRAQEQLLSKSFSQLTERLAGVDSGDYLEIAQEFSDKNQSFYFKLLDPKGLTVFSSVRFVDNDGATRFQNIIMTVGSGYTLSASADTLDSHEYSQLIGRISFGVAAMLAFGVLGSFIFARQMTRPIKKLVSDAETMSVLAPVSPPEKRTDEIGEFSIIVHEMYGKLKATIADLEEEKETQRYFFAAASHELKTPIAATTALLQGMFDDIGAYKDHPKYLWECIKMMKEQNKIINEILEIVRLADGRNEPDMRNLSLWDAVDAALAPCRALIETNEQAVEVEIPRDLHVTADDRMLNRALSNVLINAVQNTPRLGSIRVWSLPEGGLVRLCVLNTGARIDEGMIPKLFDPFFRVDEARGSGGGRSGLGLTIVAKTLERIGAPYALKNAPDGVLFYVDLPLYNQYINEYTSNDINELTR
jgi:two-component system sensor histidine kinase VanS